MAKRAKTDGSAFNPVADTLVRAVTSPQPRIVTGYPDESAGFEPLNREKRVLLTPSEERDLNTLLLELGAALGTQVQLSHLLRSAIELLKHARGEILEEARQTPGPAPAGERLPHRHGHLRAAAGAAAPGRVPQERSPGVSAGGPPGEPFSGPEDRDQGGSQGGARAGVLTAVECPVFTKGDIRVETAPRPDPPPGACG